MRMSRFVAIVALLALMTAVWFRMQVGGGQVPAVPADRETATSSEQQEQPAPTAPTVHASPDAPSPAPERVEVAAPHANGRTSSISPIAGRVRSSSGNAVAGASIEGLVLQSRGMAWEGPCTTDELGCFVLVPETGRVEQVRVEHPSYLPAKAVVEYDTSAGQTSSRDVEVVLQDAVVVRGPVLFEDGSPCSGAELRAQAVTEGSAVFTESAFGPFRPVVTREDGKFVMGSLPANQVLAMAIEHEELGGVERIPFETGSARSPDLASPIELEVGRTASLRCPLPCGWSWSAPADLTEWRTWLPRRSRSSWPTLTR